MAKRHHFVQADVFTNVPFGGNQLAVFTDARGLTTAEMQTLTREMAFSECTFVLPPEAPGAVKRVRIFTPGTELPMAGHPTVGTTYVLVARGEIPLTGELTETVLELGVGPVPISIVRGPDGPGFVWMTHPAPVFGETRADRAAVAGALGITAGDLVDDLPVQIVSTGVPFLFVPVRSLAAIGRCRPDRAALQGLFSGEPVMVYMFTTETTTAEVQIHSRMFAPHVAAIAEDPATGVAAGPLGAYVTRYGVLPGRPDLDFALEQGMELGRPSRIFVEVRTEDGRFRSIRIGGQAVIVGEGHLFW
jgi:trans-2,3-dihydro-3-hydroxyanthranilate isomerase